MDDDLLGVARTIRPYLTTLVGDEGPEYDREIAKLPREATSGAAVGACLWGLLFSPSRRGHGGRRWSG